MFLFRKKKPEESGSPSRQLVEALAKETSSRRYTFDFKANESKTGAQIMALKPPEARLFVMAALDWLTPFNKLTRANAAVDCVRRTMLELLRRRLPLEEADVLRLLDWSLEQSLGFERGTSQMIKVVENHLKEHTLNEALISRVEKLIELCGGGWYVTADDHRYQARLRELIQVEDTEVPVEPGEPWSDAVLADMKTLSLEQQLAWVKVFKVCAKASGSSPAEKWRAEATKALDAVGFEPFKQAVLKWFPLTGQPHIEAFHAGPREVETLRTVSVDLLRALVWICAQREDRELARALTSLALSSYRKVPGVGPRTPKLGNACVWALGNMPGSDAVGQLALLKLRVKFIPAQKAIDSALSAAATRLNLPVEAIEEMSAPTYGLDEVGLRRETLGGTTAELSIEDGEVALRWFQADGKKLSAAPKAVKEGFGDELKELTQAKKDMEKMLPAQSARIENLYLQEKRWKLPTWREYYQDHPLVGTLARRLIWKFSRGDRAASGIWWQGQLVDRDGQALDWLDDETSVELWHPLFVSVENTLAWRSWLDSHQVRQPFKQAHREVYLLTDAERQTRTYSNRFAAHIIKQHQFHALCGQRGWKNKLRLMVDDECPPATRVLPNWNLRAEFWVESVGDNYAVDTNDSGTYLYLATDQVRFYPVDAPENWVHASGGGYHRAWRVGPQSPLELEDVPPLVLSEIMRDVDLFVGVASVGNDPRWMDGGRERHHADYWSGYSFGALSETAKTRKQVLENLLPRLKIHSRCSLSDRFLVVKGDLRTYKIHLGSGNILMEPNDQYLCIVPARGTESGKDKVFLPFEGDSILSVILSKAFLLADDTKITDPTILRQIKM